MVRNDASAQARHAFNQVREALSYYRLLEGRNFNDSDQYAGTAPLSYLDEITRDLHAMGLAPVIYTL